LALKHAVQSHPGLARERNEDVAAALPERGLFAIADGMGGHVGGEIASRVAVETALRCLQPVSRIDLEALTRAMQQANRAVLDEADRRGLWGMGTTLTLARVDGGAVLIAHVGDTRAYLLREGRIELLTTDHTMVELLIRQGVLRRERARQHPERHVLVQALGTQAEIAPELRSVSAAPGSRLLLSSDGLHDQLGDAALLELAGRGELQACTDALVEAANRTGGPDNITVVLVEL
jgi:protein phosphatase